MTNTPLRLVALREGASLGRRGLLPVFAGLTGLISLTAGELGAQETTVCGFGPAQNCVMDLSLPNSLSVDSILPTSRNDSASQQRRNALPRPDAQPPAGSETTGETNVFGDPSYINPAPGFGLTFR